MAPNGGDNSFSDDDFDDLSNDHLVELENNAIQLTQAFPSSDYGDDYDDEDLDDAVVIDESKSTPAIIPNFQRNIPSRSSQQDQFRQQKCGGNGTLGNPHAKYASQRRANVRPPPLFNEPNPSFSRNPVAQEDSMVAEQGSQQLLADECLEALQKQVQELMKERDALKSDLNAKAGEISIVRSKQEKTVKQYEKEIVAIRKLNEEKIAKQEKALEAAKIAEKNAATERDFFRQDLAEESERVRRLNKAKAAEKPGGIVSTPKKKKTQAHRDGFDDDEIEFLSPSRVSPSKFQKRHGASPSKAGGKRKRKTVESPVAALEVRQEAPVEEPETKELVLDEAIIDCLSRQDDRFDFLGTMLDHRVGSDHQRTIQELGQYALPSEPQESFQSIILGRIPSLGSKRFQRDLSIEFCELLISIWSKCMEEKYLTPIYLLMNLLTSALEFKTTAIALSITDSIVPLVQLTADIVVIPRWKHHSAKAHEKDINVSACLELLHITALGCMSEQQQIMRFWKLMRFDFVLVMLSPNQPSVDFELMMRLLSTSVFPDSFGPIVPETTQAIQVMDNILDRLTYTLYEVPPLPQSSEKMDLGVLSQLRMEVLQLMTSMTRSPFASKAMAMHPHAIGRLVSLLSNELDDLYDYMAGHETSTKIISSATRLLYYLVTQFDDDIDIQKKLSIIRGGSQKYFLSLSRLNFCEDDLVLGSGIDSDVAACALEMLELAVTPEEGEAIDSAFSANL